MSDIVSIETMRELICEFLAGASVADHLGDIRNDEVYLYRALGITREQVHEAEMDNEEASDLFQVLAEQHGLPIPDWFRKDE